MKSKTDQVKGAHKKLEVSIYESLQFFQKDQDFFRIFVQEEGQWSIKSRLAKSVIAQERKNFSIGLIKGAQSEGLIRKDAEPRQISDMLESIITAFIFNWWEQGSQSKQDLKLAAGMIMDLFLNGVKRG